MRLGPQAFASAARPRALGVHAAQARRPRRASRAPRARGRPPPSRRTCAAARRACPGAPRGLRSAAGVRLRSLAGAAARTRCRRPRASSPASRSASAVQPRVETSQLRASCASAGDQRPGRRRPRPRAGPGPRRAAAIRSARPATASRAAQLLRPRRGAGAAASISSTACAASSSRRSSSAGSSDSSRSAASLARSARTLAPTAPRSSSWPPNASSRSRCHAADEQALLLVLAVDLDQRLDDRREPRGGDRLVVDARHGAAHGGHLADADERLRREPATVEQRLHARRGGAVPHQGRVRAAAHHQRQGVDEQRLAGAGLAREDREARLEARRARAR